MNFLKKLEKLDPELAAEAQAELEELRTQHHRELLEKDCNDRIRRAKQNLGDTISQFAYDATGQDGEAEIEAAAQDYCDAQSDKIKRTNPERWSEMRYCGLL